MQLSKKFVQLYLKFCLKILFFKHNPQIIVITGTGDCQSVKIRVNRFLAAKVEVKMTPPGYNEAVTLPLGILALEFGGRSILKWGEILIDAASITFFSAKYPKVVIADLKINKVGEMDYFLKLIKPRVVAFTTLSPALKDEYLKLANLVPEKGVVLFNRDDELQKDIGFLNTHVKYYSLAKPGELEKLVADYALGKYAY